MATWSQIARRIRVPLGFAFAILYLWRAHPTGWSIFVGLFVAALGLVIRALASGHLRKNEELAIAGPYAYVRNPLYLGSLILAAGFVIAARSWWIATALVAFFVVIYLPVMRSEEAFLRQKFPAFADYARQVPRLIPRLTPFGSGGGSFSSELYCQHREYNAIAGALAMAALLLVKLLWFSK